MNVDTTVMTILYKFTKYATKHNIDRILWGKPTWELKAQKISNIFNNYLDDNFRSCYIILKNHDWWLFKISMKSFPERLSRTVWQRHKAKWLPFVTAESHEMIKKWREGFWWEENHTGFVACTCIQERIQILLCHLKVKRVKCKLKSINKSLSLYR